MKITTKKRIETFFETMLESYAQNHKMMGDLLWISFVIEAQKILKQMDEEIINQVKSN